MITPPVSKKTCFWMAVLPILISKINHYITVSIFPLAICRWKCPKVAHFILPEMCSRCRNWPNFIIVSISGPVVSKKIGKFWLNFDPKLLFHQKSTLFSRHMWQVFLSRALPRYAHGQISPWFGFKCKY